MTLPDLGGSHEQADRFDAAFSTLADERRRRVLHYFLRTGDDVATVDDLVDHALAGDGPTGDPDRLACRLHHATLPKLDAAGFVEYDARSNTVRYRPDPVVERLLDRVGELAAEA